jgi:predicted enzyme related to lactoylglutathione lyase
MVDDIVGTSKAVVVAGGYIVQAVDLEAKEWVAHFCDPAGNVFGLYQHGGK